LFVVAEGRLAHAIGAVFNLIYESKIMASRLKDLRKEAGLSQYELADKLKLSRSLLANYEQGRREPDYSTLVLLSEFFHVSADYIIGVTNIRGRLSNEEEEKKFTDVLGDISNLSRESFEELRRYMSLLKLKDNVEKERGVVKQ